MHKKDFYNEHGYCPSCGLDLDGGGIWDHFFKEFTTKGYWEDEGGNYTSNLRVLRSEEAEIIADEVASHYGASRTKGRWGKAIALYDMNKDRTVAYRCPGCNHEWKRS